MAFTDTILEDIQSRVDLVELIGRATPLKRAGRSWKGLCPFHHEKTPSFTVSPEKQLYYCFGCQAGGNAFTFLMQTEQLTFPEAVEQLAAHVGVTVEQTAGADHQQRSIKQAIHATNLLALRYFQESLRGSGGARARAYVEQRHVRDASVQQFALGFAPDAWEGLIHYASAHGVNIQQLAAAGLVIPRNEGREGYYDRFRQRLIFPIHDAQGAVSGFGGRALSDEQEPKYMNSPETAAFVKGRQLFGLYHAKQAIAAAGHALLVEGYMDCVMLHQHGVAQTLAPLGVALTNDHARLLKRYTTEAVLLYDADDAGAQATLRSLDILVAEGLSVRIAQIEPGMDPDEFVIARGAQALTERVAQAQSLFDYKLATLRRQHPRHRVEDRVAICHAMVETVCRIPDRVLQRAYVQRLAEVLQLDEASVLANIKQPARPAVRPMTGTSPAEHAPAATPHAATESLLLGLLFEDPVVAEHVFAQLAPDQFTDPRAKAVAKLFRELLEAGETVSPHLIVARSADVGIAGFVAEAIQRAEACEPKRRALDDCLVHVHRLELEQQRQRLVARIQHAETDGNQDALVVLLRELNQLNKRGEALDGHGERSPVVSQAH